MHKTFALAKKKTFVWTFLDDAEYARLIVEALVRTCSIDARLHDMERFPEMNRRWFVIVGLRWFTRNKHDASFPKNALMWCLEERGIKVSDLDSVVFTTNHSRNLADYWKPILHLHREVFHPSCELCQYG